MTGWKTRRIATTLVGVVTAATCIVGAAGTVSAAESADPAVAAALQRVGAGTWNEADLTLIKEKEPVLASQILDPRSAAMTIETTAVKYLEGEIGPQPVPGEGDPTDVSDEQTLAPLTEAEAAGDLSNAPAPGTGATATSSISTAAKNSSTPLAPVAAASSAWKWVDVWYRHKSLTGRTIYKYHTYVKFKYNGSNVTAWGTRYDYFSAESDVADILERTENRKSGVPATAATSTMERKVKLCAPVYGCYATLYPWIKTKVKGNGSYSYTGSSH